MNEKADNENGQNDAMAIPRWFIWAMSGMGSLFLVLFVPWAGWVTMTLATISVKMENQAEVRERVDNLETQFHQHQLDPNLHQSGFSKIQNQLDSLRNRVERMENK